MDSHVGIADNHHANLPAPSMCLTDSPHIASISSKLPYFLFPNCYPPIVPTDSQYEPVSASGTGFLQPARDNLYP